MKSEEKGLDRVRASDLLALCKKRGYAVGGFLTEEEQAAYRAFFCGEQKESRFVFSFEGGVRGAERKVPVLFDRDNSGCDPAAFSHISLLLLKAAEVPDHRSVLGSVLGLGLERYTVGDIFLFEKNMAIAVKTEVAPYILGNLERVGRTAVRVEPLDLPPDFEIERKTETLLFSVSSLRLDCVVAAICRFSREDAAEYIKKGMVFVDHVSVSDPDRRVGEGKLLSLRGKGRFLLESVDGVTKSGRLKIRVLHSL